MNDREHARELIEMGLSDLKALRGIVRFAAEVDDEHFSDEVFGFHAQQAAEKFLKAGIASRGRSYPRSHDLMALLFTLEEMGVITEDLESIVDLNPFAVQYRYESLADDDKDLDKEAVLDEIERLFALATNYVDDADQ